MQVHKNNLFHLLTTCLINFILLVFLNKSIGISPSYSLQVIICDILLCYFVSTRILFEYVNSIVNWGVTILFGQHIVKTDEIDRIDFMFLVKDCVKRVIEVTTIVLCSHIFMIQINIILVTNLHLYIFYVLTYIFTLFLMIIILALSFVFIGAMTLKLTY